MHRLLSTAVPPLPAPIVEADPYAEGYAEGYAAALRERAESPGWITRYVLGVRALVETPAPDPTADKAQLAALGAASQRGDQGR